ncbi:MAG: hypothetical protein QXS85_04940 [Acidilobaceae archaeon]
MSGSSLDRLELEVLRRRDPQGFYVVPLKRGAERALASVLSSSGVSLVEAGGVVLARVRSRSLAERVLREAARRGLLALGEL